MKADKWDVKANGGYSNYYEKHCKTCSIKYGLAEEYEQEIDQVLYLNKLNNGSLFFT